MEDLQHYPVFFEYGSLRPEQRKAIEKYFRVRRRSGGGDCGPLTSVNDQVYSIAFTSLTDQQKVLEKGEHVVEFSDGPLVFTVRGSLAPDTPTQDVTAPAQECLEAEAEQELPPDARICWCPHHMDPAQVKDYLEFYDLGEIIDDVVRVYFEDGVGYVFGKDDEILATLGDDEQLAAKHRSIFAERKFIHKLGEAKRRLLWDEIVRGLGKDYPGVKVTQGDEGQVVLEGPAEDVFDAKTWICGKSDLVLERNISNKSPHFLAFLRKAYGCPGGLRDFLGFSNEVEFELGDAELHVFSFATDKLDDAEKILQSEFKEVKIDVPNCTTVPSELQEKLKSKTHEMNRKQYKAQVLFGSDSSVTLLGHTKEVEELTETVTLSLPGLTSSSDLLSPLSLSEDNTLVASYALCDGLQVLVCQGDITKQYVDALVNAANEDLDHCGGVAAALSKAGGPEVQRESKALIKYFGKVPIGDAVVTTGGNLKCKKLLHAVGPSAGRADGRERSLLVQTVQSALKLAEIMEFKSIAMPCISSGLFGVPLAVCSEAIVTAVKRFGSQEGRSLRNIILIDNRVEVVRAMQEACDRLLQGISSGNSTPSDEPESLMEPAAQDTVKEDGAGPRGHSVHVEIVQGTIESQEVDALVCPMVGHDPLSTRVGNTLSKMVGPQLTAGFRREAGDDAMPGDAVLVEGLFGLPSNASNVFFLNLAPWDGDNDGTAVEILRFSINNILTSCEMRGFRSVALPVLGSGIALRFPTSLVARVLMEQVHAFKQTQACRTSLLVRITIHPNDTESSEVFEEYKTHFYQQDQASTTKRIVLLGKTGSGKSNLANTIIGEEELFITDNSPNSGTHTCQTETRTVNGRSISLIDSPGFFDSNRTEQEIKTEIMSCITECAPGPHVFLIVLRVDKFTEQEQDVIKKILHYFSEDALKYAVIVFTHGNQLSEGKTIQEFVSENKNLSDLVKRCGGRCHVFDNKYWKNQQQTYRSNEFQVEELLNTIDKMVMENNGDYYTNEMLQVVEKEIATEEHRLKQTKVNQSEEEIRKQARTNVSNRLLIGLTATATGALLGAFFGVKAMVGLVITAVTNKTFRTMISQVPAFRAPVARVATAAAGGELAVAAAAAIGGGELAVAGAVVGAASAALGGVVGGKIGLKAAEEAESPGEAADMAYKAVKGAWDQWSRR